MDTLPHDGAATTLLVTGLTHKQTYKDILAINEIKALAALVVIAAYYFFGVVWAPAEHRADQRGGDRPCRPVGRTSKITGKLAHKSV